MSSSRETVNKMEEVDEMAKRKKTSTVGVQTIIDVDEITHVDPSMKYKTEMKKAKSPKKSSKAAKFFKNLFRKKKKALDDGKNKPVAVRDTGTNTDLVQVNCHTPRCNLILPKPNEVNKPIIGYESPFITEREIRGKKCKICNSQVVDCCRFTKDHHFCAKCLQKEWMKNMWKVPQQCPHCSRPVLNMGMSKSVADKVEEYYILNTYNARVDSSSIRRYPVVKSTTNENCCSLCNSKMICRTVLSCSHEFCANCLFWHWRKIIDYLNPPYHCPVCYDYTPSRRIYDLFTHDEARRYPKWIEQIREYNDRVAGIESRFEQQQNIGIQKKGTSQRLYKRRLPDNKTRAVFFRVGAEETWPELDEEEEPQVPIRQTEREPTAISEDQNRIRINRETGNSASSSPFFYASKP